MFSALKHWLFPRESNNLRAKILHPSGMVVLIAILLVFQFGLDSISRQYPQILGYASAITAQQIIDITNQKRASQGLSPVKYDAQLTAAAAAKGADMMARNYWAHVSPTGAQPWFFITQAGYGYRYAGENLARDFNDSAAVVQAWIDSPTHRENLFNPKYQDIGVAIIDGTLTGHETTLVVQMFGTKLAALATPKPKPVGAVNVVQAAEETPVPSPVPTPTPAVAAAVIEPVASPFSLAKIVSLAMLVVLAVVLVIDIIEVKRNKIIRWTSKSMAHLMFIIVLIIAIIIVGRGKII